MCDLHLTHSPVPLNATRHHIVPKSWGGSDLASNLVTLCPTGHENVHTVLNWLVRYQSPENVPGDLRRATGASTWALALRAWEKRPEGRIPYTEAWK